MTPVIVTTVLAVVLGVQWWADQDALEDAARLKVQVETLSEWVSVLSDSVSSRVDLEEGQERNAAAILTGKLAGEKSYHALLAELSSHDIAGISLRRVDLVTGQGILIDGTASTLGELTRFIHALSMMPALDGVTLSTISSVKTIADPVSQGEMTFTLKSANYRAEEAL